MGRAPLSTRGDLPFLPFRILSATLHCGYAPDDKDNGEHAEYQDVEHGSLDHGLTLRVELWTVCDS